jgi:hypothetical protein
MANSIHFGKYVLMIPKAFMPLIVLYPVFYAACATAQDYRPGLLFREDWKETPAEVPVSQQHVAHSRLLFASYGPGLDSLKKSHHDQPSDDPYYVWSGLCTAPWAISLAHKDFLADMSGYARVRWRSKQAGFHHLRILLRLDDGTWLISDVADGASKDWRVCEFNMKDIAWWTFNISTMSEVRPVTPVKVDLSRVDAIGCTDLRRGGGSQACSRLDWIEVYARPVPR